jgi:DNA repair photolyase
MQNMIPEQSQNLIDETVSMADATAKLQGKVTFVNNPVKIFGILFNHAFPLDLSITKYCFQGCPFCFATANKRFKKDVIGKTEDPTDHFMRLLQKANGQGYEAQNLAEYAVRNKYPIIFSNNVDPFMPASESKFKLGERVLEACIEHKQPLFIQTKEVYYGDRVRELLIKGKDLFQVYVSLSTLDYETAKRYETVAITPDERLKRIKDLTSQGVQVVVACNPYVPEWMGNMKVFAQAVKDSGATGIFTYPHHSS